METTTVQEAKEAIVQEEKKGKRKWLTRFLNFLMYGGWLLVVIVIVSIITLISYLTR